MRVLRVLIILLIGLTGVARAAMHTENVEYKQGDAVLEGYLAYDDAFQGTRPGVLVVHEWKGLNDYARMRADTLAKLGYVAFAADIYGKGIRPQTNEEASATARKYYADIPLLRARVNAGLDMLRKQPNVDTTRIAAIGYCFGGMTVLELARSGAKLNGVVSFHGGLSTPNPDDAKNIKCKVLVCHGGSDPSVPMQQLVAFEQEMTNAGVDFEINIYGHAVHGFTNPANGNDPSRGVAYNEEADHRSWQAMRDFFAEIFK
jgi:dienelactone hydrolase